MRVIIIVPSTFIDLKKIPLEKEEETIAKKRTFSLGGVDEHISIFS